MNSELHQYPAALYSSVSEIGYRRERFTGEVLRSGSGHPRGAHRRTRLSQFRLWLSTDRRPSAAVVDLRDAPSQRRAAVRHAPHAHAG